MELLKDSRKNVSEPASAFGIESGQESQSDKSEDDQFWRTAECAYYKAESRGFEPGFELEDWFFAESEVGQ